MTYLFDGANYHTANGCKRNSFMHIQWSCSLVTFCVPRYCYSLNYRKGHCAGIETQASQVLSKQISRFACWVIWLGPSQVELNCQSKCSKYEYLRIPMVNFLLIGWNWQVMIDRIKIGWFFYEWMWRHPDNSGSALLHQGDASSIWSMTNTVAKWKHRVAKPKKVRDATPMGKLYFWMK